MREIKPQFIGRTLEVWQPRTSRKLTIEDAREITENVTGLFQVLFEWETAEQQTASEPTKNKSEAECHVAGRCRE
jgi:hypothetical protein